MYKRILVPLDGSKAAERVIPYAEEVTAKLGSQIILVSVSESATKDTELLYPAYLERVTEQVQHQLNDWEAKKEAQVQSKVLMGKPANEILHYAEKANVGLIAMTSRGASGPGHWLLGNIAEKVLRATTKPLLLVRVSIRHGRPFRQKRLIRRIMVPLDGSELGATALPHAQGLGQALEAELVFFHAVEPEAITGRRGIRKGTPPSPKAQAQERAKADAIAYLEDAAKSTKDMGLVISTAVHYGSAPECIIDYAEANSIDLIAISTHGRTGNGRWVFGGVSDKVLHYADTDILVVRPTKAQLEVTGKDS